MIDSNLAPPLCCGRGSVSRLSNRAGECLQRVHHPYLAGWLGRGRGGGQLGLFCQILFVAPVAQTPQLME
ncbi:MAG: hypothetical protein M3Y07_09495, partial [Acidobacteriota bacterium]|nr:hypothetical protein [Acidobacteriota bacterium]